MNRLRSAEIDLNAMISTTKELVSIININRLRNLMAMVVLKVKWVKEMRKKAEKVSQNRIRHAIKKTESQGGLTSGAGSTSYVGSQN